MQPRKKQPLLTRQALLAAAGAEFARHGYAGTALGAIVARAGLTKGALFHHFADKQALAAAWITDALTAELDALWLTPLAALDSLDGLRALCRARCLALQPGDAISALVALTAETAVTEPLLGAALEDIFARWRAAAADVLARGQAAGWIHRSIQPAGEAVFLVAAIAGFSVTTRGQPDVGLRRSCATALEGYLDTLRAP